jgi:SAM-dependent methyltransferase
MSVTFEQAQEAARSQAIVSLDISMFTPDDVVNFILQRSEILRDHSQPGQIIKAWSNGNPDPARALATTKGEEIIRRALGFIYLEFQELKPLLQTLSHHRIADIGCGYGVFDLFMARELKSDVVLIDLETNTHKHFGFKNEGAAYSNLERAKEFLVANRVAKAKISTLNPALSDVNAVRDVDIAFSFISCGFHYPWQTYEPFFRDSVKPQGSVILDVRTRNSALNQQELGALGTVTLDRKAAYGSADRLWIKKTG